MIRLKAHDYLKFTHNGENSGMNNKKIKSDNEISELCSFSIDTFVQMTEELIEKIKVKILYCRRRLSRRFLKNK